jgi:hypothetical protein
MLVAQLPADAEPGFPFRVAQLPDEVVLAKEMR